MGLIDAESDIHSSNLEPSRKRNHQEEQQTKEYMECPRCGSLKTKFCYYNNYNKSQPRHFCKGCKRYWTKGGTLRDVPPGGGRRKKCRKLSNVVTHKNIPSVSSTDHNAPMSSSDSLIPPQTENNDNRISNNFLGDNINNGMFFVTSSQDQNKQFSFSEMSAFGGGLPCFAANNQALDTYGYTRMPDWSLESTVTTTMPMGGTNTLSCKPCQYSFSGASMDVSSLWEWNQINSLVSADLDVPWNDAELKF